MTQPTTDPHERDQQIARSLLDFIEQLRLAGGDDDDEDDDEDWFGDDFDDDDDDDDLGYYRDEDIEGWTMIPNGSDASDDEPHPPDRNDIAAVAPVPAAGAGDAPAPAADPAEAVLVVPAGWVGRSVREDPVLLSLLTAWTWALLPSASPSVWCFAVDEAERLTDHVLPLAMDGARPDRDRLDRFFGDVHRGAAGSDGVDGVILVIVRADGGDRGGYERAWHAAVTAAAKRHGVRLRCVAALGARRASLL